VNNITRVWLSALKLCVVRIENGPRNCVTESSATALFAVPCSMKIVGGVGVGELSKTFTSLLPALVKAKSSFPSLLKSPAASDSDNDPAW
jgi:hypothetical protein